MILTADLHLDNHGQHVRPVSDPRFPGCNSRAVEILRAFEGLHVRAEAGGHRYVVVAGDVFHRRGVLPIPLLNALVKVIVSARKDRGVVTVLLPGNHDYVDRDALHAGENLHALHAMSDGTAIVIDQPQVMKMQESIGDSVVGFIPYTPLRERWLACARTLSGLVGSVPGSALTFLFAHQSFDGARTGPHEYVMREGVSPSDVPCGFDSVISGHYHMTQSVGPVTYVGGLLQHNLGERDYVPGWMETTKGGGLVRLVNDVSPRFLLYEGEDHEEVDRLVRAARVRGDHLSVRWTGDVGTEPVSFEEDVRVTASPPSMTSSRLPISGADAPEAVAERYVEHVEASVGIPVERAVLLEAGRRYLLSAAKGRLS